MDVAGLHDRSHFCFWWFIYLEVFTIYVERTPPSLTSTGPIDLNPGSSVRQAGVLTTLLLVSLS